MPKFKVIVKPKDGTFVGWDVDCCSWKTNRTGLTWHELAWSEPEDGKFVGESGELTAGIYGLHCSVIDPGRKISVSIDEDLPVVQPADSEWPLAVEVDAATGTRTSDTWYFRVGAGA